MLVIAVVISVIAAAMVSCCSSLRTRSIIVGSLGVLGGIGSFILGILQIGGATWINIVVAAIYFIGYGSVLLGSYKYHRTTFLVGLVATASLLVLQVILVLYFLLEGMGMANCVDKNSKTAKCNNDDHDDEILVTAGGYAILTGIHTYFFLCNFSFYKTLIGSDFKPLVEEDFQ